jgi:hypothetical protein
MRNSHANAKGVTPEKQLLNGQITLPASLMFTLSE